MLFSMDFVGQEWMGCSAQMCNNPDVGFKTKAVSEIPNLKWGFRKAILCDLSPLAGFIII